MRRCAYWSVLLVTLVPTFQTAAQSPPPAMPLDIEEVALFKNGLGFFSGQVVCSQGQTHLRVVLPAAPTHGTLWISYPTDLHLAHAVAKDVESTQTQDAITIPELLQANVGRTARIAIEDREITGTITYFARNRPFDSDGPDLPRPSYNARLPHQPAALVTIQTDVGLVAINPQSVTSVTFTGGDAEREVALPGRQTELDVQLNQPASGQKLTVTFLARGISWAPSYLVDISQESQARMSAKALVINDACELKDVSARLITGIPHLQFADTLSPIALKQSLEQFLQSLNRGERPRGREAAIITQNVAYGGAGMGAPDYGTPQAGTVAEDLFLYPAGRIDLDRDQVAYVPLFTASVPYEHIYKWDIPDYVDERSRYTYSPERDSQDEEQEVWHSLKLTNRTQVPWTTAPGETIKNGSILGQDTLKYTPEGSTAMLRITRAVGVKAEQIELETSRKREALRMYGETFDLITVKGDLSIVNTQSKAITLEITKTLSGEVQATDPQAKQQKLAQGLTRMNGVSKLTWTLDLAPGSERKITYVYEVYVRR